jgi:thiol:disulfide interchange protein DsbD
MTRFSSAALAVFLAVLALSPAPAARAADPSDLLPVDEAYVLTAKAVDRNRIEFHFKIAKGYYLYRHRFGVSAVDSAFKTNPLQIPDGEKHVDQFFGPVETYRDEVTLVQTGATASGVDVVGFKVRYQGCADVGVCYPPQTRTLTVAMPVDANAPAPANVAGSDALAGLAGVAAPVDGVLGAGEALPAEQAFKAEAIANTPTELLVRLTPSKGYYLYRDKTSFRIAQGDGVVAGTPRFPATKPYHDEHFGDVQVWFDYAEIPLPLQRKNGAAQSITLEAKFQGCLTDGLCYPPMTRLLQVSLPAANAATLAASASAGAVETPPARAAAQGGLLFALLSALLGGLILNLMPCVLPVLSFKALGLAQASASRAHARGHALWYTAGVLASFALAGGLVLGLRGAGQALGWGFQLQQPWLVGALSLLMLAIGLALSGVMQFGASLAGVGQSLAEKSGAAGDFFTGVLAVVVASPCTAPFMAGALGYAFVAPTASAMLVFLALGLGLALPFLLIGFVPALAARLPRPGPWMESLKQWLAFPMYLTAVWLAWVFGKQRGVDALGLLLVASVLLALAMWWLERRRYRSGRIGALLPGLALALAIAALVLALRVPAPAAHAAQVAPGRVPYSAQALAQYRAQGRAVFVDMTADWCITCKVNEKAVLDTDEFRALLKDTGTVYMVGDWTDQDASISAFLDQFHSPGVPLYVVFPAGGGEGRRLPQLLSISLMHEALAGKPR